MRSAAGGADRGPRSANGNEEGETQASRYQSCRAEKSRSQIESDGTSFSDRPRTRARFTSGITQPDATTRSFMRMKCAARLTGSSSLSAAANAASYSGLLQRLLFRLCHLFAFCEISEERNWRKVPAGSCA